ncbi:Hsp70 family protein [Marivita cryptomonadis]|uniref:Hsp70 family protein n=1 Tax=Marivita cryptomonadis TaxID=505252 RepID=A0A9Q2NT50_9RHOB|nr:Hsp70 family protein [Marivita cryptomonadis]MBM2330094.1 Hsp70 family protein [Marivita cryptomonadis]MBM2339681.1 Hsp70 family protein [Marivita cryptomonadis]MBM2344340.1 Hsp70 family protein [Marivita cryptomonadis]MBM2349018.1 Hsp70 family protein [Marivita cryptomonadis]
MDLGTSNSAVVGHIDGATRLFKTSDGTDVLPSVIYLDKRGHRFIGKSAYDRLLSAPQNVAQGFKRSMGTKNPISFAGQTWTPVECSAEIIKALVGQAMTEAGNQEVEGVVITTPAAFNQMQSEDTIAAARLAGLEKVSLLQEPVAAALAAIAHSKQKDGVFLVYDLGGGTFDLALVMSTAGVVNVIAHEGINMLGGRDFDRIIFDSIVRPWLTQTFNLPADFQRNEKYKHLSDVCRHAAEKAKIQLSASSTASIFATEDEVRASDEGGEEIYISIDLTREQMTDLIKDRIDDSIALCRKIITANGYKNDDISKIVPIGGPSKMPIIRDMLEAGLAIEVETGLDPMTAVATGAAIFAESREWAGESSTQKSGKQKEAVTGSVSLALAFSSRVASETTKVRLKPAADMPTGHEVEILDEEGSSTGRIPIDGPLSINVNVRKNGENRFKVTVFDQQGKAVEDASREIVITRAEASAASVPMTYTLAVKIQHGFVGYERNKLEVLVKKGTALPAQGKQTFRTGKTLVGGEDDFIAVEFYEMADDIDTPEHNLHIGNFRLNSRDELERGERINRGDDFVIDWKMSDNGTLSFSVELPSLGRVIDATNLYRSEDGGINYDGQRGAEVATTMLARVESDLDELETTLDEDADPNGDIRKRIERQHAALSTSVDADTHRSVAEEARKLRQEVALLKMSPENEERVLDDEVAKAETSFDELRDIAQPVDTERHDKLLVTTRRSIREKNYDAARRSLDEMQGIRMKVLAESPDFLIEIFRRLAEEHHLAVDEALHAQLVEAGVEAAKSGDVERLRMIIGQMFGNRVSTGADATEIVELAHLLGS